MRLIASLTNRIFVASALLAVLSIAIAVYNMNVAVSRQAEQELMRGLEEADALVGEYRRLLMAHFSREARLVADLPKLKAAVETGHPPTVQPLARDYLAQLGADLLLVTRSGGDLLAAAVPAEAGDVPHEAVTWSGQAPPHAETATFLRQPGGILQMVSVPISIGSEFLGTLSVGFALDPRTAGRFRSLTNSEIAFGMDGRIEVSTLPEDRWPALAALLGREGVTPSVWLAGNEYIVSARSMEAGPDRDPASLGAAADRPVTATALILRSRTERLQFLTALHRTLAAAALLAVLAAIALSYAIARTVTRPLGAVTAAMREMAATGDLTRRIVLPAGARWEDEDARLLAATFNAMTESIARFQREAAQRERLSSLGRLSTVVAHEIRNPLMIIKMALRTLRRGGAGPPESRAALADIDEEVVRLNRIVEEVLDFARPIEFHVQPVDLNALCVDAARAAATPAPGAGVTFDLDPALPPVATDGERLRQVLVNVLANAQHAVAARGGSGVEKDAILVRTRHTDGAHVAIEVRDRGIGVPADDLPRVFEPYFTSRRTGSGLGLAISRNIVEGLGGTIALSSDPGEGAHVRIVLPCDAAVPRSRSSHELHHGSRIATAG